jgi:bile acid:Na+ symporter, BASS family
MGGAIMKFSVAASDHWQGIIKKYGRTVALLLVMAAGFASPQAQVLSPLLQYLLMSMLFFAFLDLSLSRSSLHPSLGLILLANVSLPFVWFLVARSIRPELALAAFLTAATPTATAAPVIVGFLRGRVEYAIGAVIATNIVMALTLPFTLPMVAGSNISLSSMDLLPSVLVTMFLPLGLAWIIRLLPAGIADFARKGKPVSFPVWLIVIFIVTSKASAFLWEHAEISRLLLLEIAAVSLVICSVNFLLGAWLGGPTFRREGSQALGQKNTAFTIWIALTFLNPLTALGPTFYIAYHNIYNAYQLMVVKDENPQ